MRWDHGLVWFDFFYKLGTDRGGKQSCMSNSLQFSQPIFNGQCWLIQSRMAFCSYWDRFFMQSLMEREQQWRKQNASVQKGSSWWWKASKYKCSRRKCKIGRSLQKKVAFVLSSSSVPTSVCDFFFKKELKWINVKKVLK